MINLQIGTRDNLSRDITWSASIPIDEVKGKGVKFFTRQTGVGKFIRFRFIITNGPTEAYLVSELYLISVFLMQMVESDNVK